MAPIDEIDRPTDMAFLLFYLAEEISGITKVQKLLFLIEEETKFGAKYGDKVGMDFYAYKMGPFSPQVYDEVEFLLNLNALEQEKLEMSASDSFELSKYTHSEEGSEGLSNKRFILTDKGKKIASELAEVLSEEDLEELEELVEKYNKMSLMQVLEYVYTEYPNMTENSDIKHKVLS